MPDFHKYLNYFTQICPNVIVENFQAQKHNAEQNER